ncbi:MAG TPA: nucleotidyltransferase family protein, partial [Anseongella sp.]|nr:nucleotidyltransferase family protein [Anseongella sp.]
LGAEYVLNRQFGEGIASSIRCGLGYLMEFHRKVDHVIIMACDQPYVDGTHILALINKHKAAGTKIVASFYSNRKGIPALFHRTVFPELLALTGDRGAKGIIEKHESTAVVPFPAGAIDIDTEEAYKALNNDQG